MGAAPRGKRRARGVWARRYKIHAKPCLVVRREGHHIRRYVHLATGNYNPSTARLYTDIGLLTCRRISARRHKFLQSAHRDLPVSTDAQTSRRAFELHKRMLQLIERETENARNDLPARIIAKVNSLAEPQIIEALYRASAGRVKIDLIVRGSVA